MKKPDEILKEAQDLEFRRMVLVRAGVIRVSHEPDVPTRGRKRAEAAPKQDKSDQ